MRKAALRFLAGNLFVFIAVIQMLFISMPSNAVQPITDAFGIKLGSKATVNKKYINKKARHEFYHSFDIAPPTPNKTFTNYHFKSDLKGQKVFDVSGTSSIQGKDNCLDTLENLKKSLILRYGSDIDEARGKHDDGRMYETFLLVGVNGNMIAVACYEVDPWGDKRIWTSNDRLQFYFTINYWMMPIAGELNALGDFSVLIDQSGL
ncbi:MAG: hypothetical protein HRU20_07675 [Pseudomonadales bacterium]|nr:hypothetical protein [Pseudomonadales bacterium]